jgi:hypothetical protein
MDTLFHGHARFSAEGASGPTARCGGDGAIGEHRRTHPDRSHEPPRGQPPPSHQQGTRGTGGRLLEGDDAASGQIRHVARRIAERSAFS